MDNNGTALRSMTWMKYGVVPRAHTPCVPSILLLYLGEVGSLQMSIYNLLPVMFGVNDIRTKWKIEVPIETGVFWGLGFVRTKFSRAYLLLDLSAILKNPWIQRINDKTLYLSNLCPHPPRIPPFSGHKALLRRGVGIHFIRPPLRQHFIPPSAFSSLPPTPRRVFSGWGRHMASKRLWSLEMIVHNSSWKLLPLGPKLLLYITLLFRMNFPDYVIILQAGTTPILEKTLREWRGKWNLSFRFPSIPGTAPGVTPRIVVFVLLKSWDAIPRMEFRIPRMEFRSCSENSPRAPRMAFHSESVFPEIGVVPRFLNNFIISNELTRLCNNLYIAELVVNYFLGYVISCVVTEHTMWASDYITSLFSN